MSQYSGKYNPRDVMGVEIEEGDTVAYPVRRASRMEMKVATVCEVSVVHGGPLGLSYAIVCLNDRGRRIVLSVPSRITIVRKCDDSEN